MNRSIRWIALLVLLLGMSSLACGLGGGDEEEATTVDATAQPEEESDSGPSSPDTELATKPAPRATEESAPMPEATDEPSGAAISPALAQIVRPLADLESYRAQISISYEGQDEAGNDASGSMTLEALYVQEPPANSLTVNMDGIEDAPESQALQIVRLEDTIYTAMGGFGCFAGSSEELGDISEPFEDLLNPQEQMLQDVQDIEFVGEETHNGYLSDCYAFDESDVGAELGEMDTVAGLICVSKEYGHVSYLRVEGTGSSAADLFGSTGFTGSGNVLMEYNISDINEPFDISIPADCANAGENSVWPIVEGASELSQFQGLVTYSTTMEFGDILEFYDTEMAALGFDAEEDALIQDGSLAIVSYSDGTQTVSVTVSQDGGGEGFQVLIAPGQ